MNQISNLPIYTQLSADKNHLTDIVSTYLQNFLSDNTRMAYTTDFFDFAAFLQENFNLSNNPNQISKKHVIAYRDYLRENYAPNTIHRKLSSLASLFSELHSNGIIQFNPISGIKRPKAVNLKAQTGFSDSEINSICGFYNSDTIQSLQNKSLLVFLCYTGCRISEAINIKCSDIVFEQDIPVIKIIGKGSKLRKIPLNPKLWVILKEQMATRYKVDDDYIFTSIQKKITSPITRVAVHKMLKKTLLALGFNNHCSLHSFRRSVISNLLQNGNRIEAVAQILSHSNINTTKSYLVREEKMEDNPLLSLKFKDS